MPRQMGELRRLLAEWNSLVPLAQERGINVRPRAHFHMDRVIARQMVADLRSQVAPFYQATATSQLALEAAMGSDTFGVEIECFTRDVSREEVARRVRDSGVLCQTENLNHLTRTHWKVTTDGSLGSVANSMEVVSPALDGEEGFDALRKVSAALVASGGRINKRCGLHVH